MPESSRRVYIDSDVYLNVILGNKDTNPERFPTSMAVIERGQRGDYQIVSPALIYAEVACNGKLRSEVGQSHRDRARRTIGDWFTKSGIQLVSVERFVVDKASELSAAYRLRSNDAIHLASAILTRCDHFFSWNKKDFPMGETVEGVQVSEPLIMGQQELL